jgi:hypothetical protein
MAEHDLAMYLMAQYHMWLARNDARNEPMIESPETIAPACCCVDGGVAISEDTCHGSWESGGGALATS